jgi:hypothetical protein
VNLAAVGRFDVFTTQQMRRIFMSMRRLRAGLSGLAIMLVPLSKSVAHEIVGNRFFPATLGIDDPGVNDGLAFPTVSSFKTGDATLQTPVSNTFTSGTMTTGTVNPGFIRMTNTFQLGVEALIPINRRSGTNVGVIAQPHFYLDDIDPRGIGRPIFGNAPPPATPFGGN